MGAFHKFAEGVVSFFRRVFWALIKITVIGTLALLGVLYFHYGTIEPCGMLKQEVRFQIFEGAEPGDSTAELLGFGVKVRGADLMIDAMVAPLTPSECVEHLIEVVDDGWHKRKEREKREKTLEQLRALEETQEEFERLQNELNSKE